jgi:5'-3' exonuclease
MSDFNFLDQPDADEDKSFEELLAEETLKNKQKQTNQASNATHQQANPETLDDDKIPELILIDVSGILYKQYEGRKAACKKDPSRSPSWFAKHPSGQGVVNVDGVAGYLNFFEREILSSFGADRIIHVLDSKNGSASRKKIYPAYKANRKPKPEEFVWQDSIMGDVLTSTGQIVAYADEHEADDVIGTLARLWMKNKKGKVLIISYDKDMTQLVSEKNDDSIPTIAVASWNKGWVIYNDNDSVFKKMGVLPIQVADFLALCGDTTDGIPGIKGIGDKSAAELLNQYGTIDTLIQHQDEVPKKMGEKLRAESHLLPLFKELTSIKQYLKEDESVIVAPKQGNNPELVNGWLKHGKPFPLTGKDYTKGAVYPEAIDANNKNDNQKTQKTGFKFGR